jgi:hypothetical protein
VSGRGEEGQEFRAGAVKGVKKGDFLPHVAACGSRTALSRVCWYSIDCTLFSTYSRRALTTHVRGCLRPLPACTMPVHSRGLHSAMLPQVALGLVPVCACSTRCRAGRLHVRLLVSVTACWLPLPPPPPFAVMQAQLAVHRVWPGGGTGVPGAHPGRHLQAAGCFRGRSHPCILAHIPSPATHAKYKDGSGCTG